MSSDMSIATMTIKGMTWHMYIKAQSHREAAIYKQTFIMLWRDKLAVCVVSQLFKHLL